MGAIAATLLWIPQVLGCPQNVVREIVAGGAPRPANQWHLAISNVEFDKLTMDRQARPCGLGAIFSGSLPDQTRLDADGEEVRIQFSSRATAPAKGHIVPILLQRTFSPPAAAWTADAFLNTHLTVSIDKFRTVGRGVSYVEEVFLLKDRTSKRQFWLSVQIWDPRGFDQQMIEGWPTQPKTFVMRDDCATCTGLPNFLTVVSAEQDYLSKSPQSEQTFSEIGQVERRIAFSISSAQLAAAIGRLKTTAPSSQAFSNLPTDYTLEIAGIEVESWVGAHADVWLQATLKNWSVELGHTSPEHGGRP